MARVNLLRLLACGLGGAWHGGALVVSGPQTVVCELDGLGYFGGADAGGDVFAGDVLVALVVMVPPSQLSFRWWSWWSM